MSFKIWLEDGNSLNSQIPEITPKPQDKSTPASSEVERTGLQPQVDAKEIETKVGQENDKIAAVDQEIEHMDMSLPDGDDSDTPKINQFKKMWELLKDQWEKVKMSDLEAKDDTPEGLGLSQGDSEKMDMMRKHPNMTPSPGQMPSGPGTFGIE